MTSVSSSESELPEKEILKRDKRGRVRVSKQRRELILDAFERSGMSGAAFARLHGMNYYTFAGWVQRRQRDRQGQSPKTREKPAPGSEAPLALAEVKVKRSSQETVKPAWDKGLRVEAPGGAVLFITERSQLPWAAELLRTLSSC